jgi:5-formyltetrahydrofolate cyclo-ligase
MPTPASKNNLRRQCLKRRHSLTAETIAEASHQIAQRIQSLESYQKSHHIAWYHPVGGEVDLSGLWQQALNAAKSCYCPVIQANKTLLFLPFTTTTTWLKNRYGIPEPAVPLSEAKPITQLDLIFLPVVAFDPSLARLGSGAGYYDKTLAKYHPCLIGVAYEWQKQTSIPLEPWDIKLDAVITESNMYSRTK